MGGEGGRLYISYVCNRAKLKPESFRAVPDPTRSCLRELLTAQSSEENCEQKKKKLIIVKTEKKSKSRSYQLRLN